MIPFAEKPVPAGLPHGLPCRRPDILTMRGGDSPRLFKRGRIKVHRVEILSTRQKCNTYFCVSCTMSIGFTQ